MRHTQYLNWQGTVVGIRINAQTSIVSGGFFKGDGIGTVSSKDLNVSLAESNRLIGRGSAFA